MKRESLRAAFVTAQLLSLTGCIVGNVTDPPPEEVKGKAHLRVAHLSPGAPAVDLCVAPRGSGQFAGPVFKGIGLNDGLKYGEVSRYLQLDAKAYDVRVVAPGADDCELPLAGLHDLTTLPALPKDGKVTVAAIGELTGGFATPFELTAYVDAPLVVADKAQLRVIHASPGTGSVDVGVKSGSGFTPVFSGVGYGQVSPVGAYLAVNALEAVTLAVRAAGQSADVLVAKNLTVPAGKTVSAYAIGKLGSQATPLKVLLCLDEETLNHVASCVVAGETEPQAMVRIAHLSPDAPAVDVCLATNAHGTDFVGPVLKANGLANGLSYKSLSPFVSLKAGKYFARLVAAGAVDCAGPLPGVPDLVALPELAPEAVVTVAALGKAAGGSAPFRLKAFVDSRTAKSGEARLRFVHASPGTPAVDIGLGRGLTFDTVFGNVAFGDVETGDAFENGYLTVPGLNNAQVSARAAGASADVLTVNGVTLVAGQTATAFAIGELGSSSAPLQVLICLDSGPGNGCAVATVAGEPARLRVAHLAPDAPAVDVCLASKGSTTFRGPVLKALGVTAGLSYSQVTNYVALSEGAYTVRIVAPNAASCSQALAGLPDVTDLPELTSGVRATVAATGLLAAGAANPFKVRAYVDQVGASAGKSAVRFVHAAAGAPSVDVGIGAGTSYVPLFLDNAFGKSTAYAERDPIIAHVVFSVRLTGTQHVALEVSGFTIDAGNSATLFAIGTVNGPKPLQALLCQDRQESGLLASCVIKH